MARKTPVKSKTSKILRIAIYVATAALLLSGILIPLAARDNTIPPAVTPPDTGVTTSAPSGTAPGTTPPGTGTTTGVRPSLEPLAIVSVVGPVPPINPGGPIVEITLQNITRDTVTSLTASLKVGGPTPGQGTFAFNFDTPVLPGKNAVSKQGLIAAGFDSSAQYPLTISGTLQNGDTFSYTRPVVISPPAK